MKLFSQQSIDRNARRKERVERRLHQIEAQATTLPPTTPPADVTNDLSEFAKLYFNDHPRSPEGKFNHNTIGIRYKIASRVDVSCLIDHSWESYLNSLSTRIRFKIKCHVTYNVLLTRYNNGDINTQEQIYGTANQGGDDHVP